MILTLINFFQGSDTSNENISYQITSPSKPSSYLDQKVLKNMEAISLDNKQISKSSVNKESTVKPVNNSYSSHNTIVNNSTHNKLNTPKQPPPIPPKNINSKYTDTAKTNTVVDNFKPTANNKSPQNTNGIDKKSVPNKPVEKNEPPKKMDHIKRPKKNKTQKMSEADARKILENMVTPGDPHDKYTLKNKLGSG